MLYEIIPTHWFFISLFDNGPIFNTIIKIWKKFHWDDSQLIIKVGSIFEVISLGWFFSAATKCTFSPNNYYDYKTSGQYTKNLFCENAGFFFINGPGRGKMNHVAIFFLCVKRYAKINSCNFNGMKLRTRPVKFMNIKSNS